MNQTTADILEWIDNNTLVGFGNKYVAVHELKYFLQHSLVSEPVVMNKDKILAEIAELFEPKWGYNTKEQWLKLVADILTAHEKKTTHSKSEYRRLKAQGVDVLPPEEIKEACKDGWHKDKNMWAYVECDCAGCKEGRAEITKKSIREYTSYLLTCETTDTDFHVGMLLHWINQQS